MHTPKSNYTWEEVSYNGKTFICITDEGGNFMSVTNNAENVLLEISQERNLPFTDEIVIYRDSLGEWDGLNPHWKDSTVSLHPMAGQDLFYHLGAKDRDTAIEKAYQKFH